jgi:hypothetical protein
VGLPPDEGGHDGSSANVVLLWIWRRGVAVIIYMLGGKALWFVLAPTLLIYAFMNWDLFAVAPRRCVVGSHGVETASPGSCSASAPRPSSTRRC